MLFFENDFYFMNELNAFLNWNLPEKLELFLIH